MHASRLSSDCYANRGLVHYVPPAASYPGAFKRCAGIWGGTGYSQKARVRETETRRMRPSSLLLEHP
jgi:hypothetical protein